MEPRKHPSVAVDIIIEIPDSEGRAGIVLIERRNPPHGWAFPGGFVDYGESLEEAAVREAFEETSLRVDLVGQLRTYSDPRRDPRGHTISTIFVARAKGRPEARDDARDIGVFVPEDIRFPLAFDHRDILNDYLAKKKELHHG